MSCLSDICRQNDNKGISHMLLLSRVKGLDCLTRSLWQYHTNKSNTIRKTHMFIYPMFFRFVLASVHGRGDNEISWSKPYSY